jgi:toxin ParE1/3/4
MKHFRVNFSLEAKEHLRDLRDYIAERASKPIARRYLEAILRECESLSLTPYRGESRLGLQGGLRTVGFRGSISILFRIQPEEGSVDIAAILYRGRLPSEAHRYEHREPFA